MENQDNPGSKGHSGPLASSDSLEKSIPSSPKFEVCEEIPLEQLSNLVPVSPSPPAPFYTPLTESIRPLTSTGLFSPPSVLPPVTLPLHPPLSPITFDWSGLAAGDSSPASPSGPNQLLNQGIQLSSVEAWADQIAASLEAEWDPYNSSPTFNKDDQFWQSRPRLSTTNPGFLSDTSVENSPAVTLVNIQCSDLDTCLDSSFLNMAPPAPTVMSRADQLNLQKHNLDQLRKKLL